MFVYVWFHSLRKEVVMVDPVIHYKTHRLWIPFVLIQSFLRYLSSSFILLLHFLLSSLYRLTHFSLVIS